MKGYKTIKMKGYKTIIFAALVAAFGAAIAILPTLQEAMTPERYAFAFMVVSVANAVLRVITTTPIGNSESA